MMCFKCGGKTKVNATIQGETVERFRKCTKCGYSFQTVEAPSFDSVWREHAKRTYENDKLQQYVKED